MAPVRLPASALRANGARSASPMAASRRSPETDGGNYPAPEEKWAYIMTTMAQRRLADNALLRRMITIRDHANGDVTIPLPDVEEEPNLQMLIPGLIYDGIEGTAMQCAGPTPNIHVPAVNMGIDVGKGSREYANIRRRALYAHWYESRMPLLWRRAYRQLTGYGSMALVAVPNFDDGMARIEYRDALTAYPEPRAAEDIRPPANVGFVYGRSADWIAAHYPESRALLARVNPSGNRQQLFNGLWDLVEWIDEYEVVIGILGPRNLYATSVARPVDIITHAASGLMLRRWRNKTGRCTAVVPRRVTLDRIAGQLDNIVPIVDWMARFMALDTLAAEKFIYPDMVAIGEPGSSDPRITSNNGEWQDGRTGKINLVAGVKDIKYLNATPGAATTQLMQMLERAARVTGGSSQLYGGDLQGTGSLRTGRAIDSLGSFSIDPRVQELQTIMSYCLTDLNAIVLDLETGYWPKKKFTVFSGWPADEGMVEYVPAQHFAESNKTIVSYVFPGVDISQITVGIAQLTGAGLMSKRTARDKHPFIEDGYNEEQLIALEKLDDALSLSLQQQVSQGAISLEAAAKIRKEVQTGTPWADAIITVSEAEQKRQAAKAQAMAMAQQGAPPGPDVQPGLSQLDQGLAGQQLAGPSQPQKNLSDLVRAVAAPARYGNPRQGAPGGARP